MNVIEKTILGIEKARKLKLILKVAKKSCESCFLFITPLSLSKMICICQIQKSKLWFKKCTIN